MKILAITASTLLSCLLAGCGPGPDAPPAVEKNEGVIPEHHLQALDKAKGTEDMLREAEEQRRKAMEEQGI